MKEYSPEHIEGARQFFTEQGFPIEEAHVGELVVPYFVLPQALEPNLPDFAYRATRTDPETQEVTGIFGVSDSVPPDLRPYWAAHEIIEFTEIGINEQGRCRNAEQRAIDLVPPLLKNPFIDRRATFFSNLSGYFRKDIAAGTGNYTRADLGEAESTLSYLQSLRG